jgi:hypothetical protein
LGHFLPLGLTGLPDFSWYNTPKREKMYQRTTEYSKMTKCSPNSHEKYQHVPFQVHAKYTLFGLFGLFGIQIHLATLLDRSKKGSRVNSL